MVLFKKSFVEVLKFFEVWLRVFEIVSVPVKIDYVTLFDSILSPVFLVEKIEFS